MHKLQNRTYFQITALMLTSMLLLGTISTGLAHVRCLVEDHTSCGMHAGDVGSSHDIDTNHKAGSTTQSHDCCTIDDSSTDIVVQTKSSQDMAMEECLCFNQTETNLTETVKPATGQEIFGKTSFKVEAVLDQKFYTSLYSSQLIQEQASAHHSPEAVHLLNGILLN